MYPALGKLSFFGRIVLGLSVHEKDNFVLEGLVQSGTSENREQVAVAWQCILPYRSGLYVVFGQVDYPPVSCLRE